MVGIFFDLALSTPSGRNTNVLPVDVVAPPPGKPFVSGTSVGRIALGSSGLREVISGERLAHAREVLFTPPVVTASLLPGLGDSVGWSLECPPGR